MTMFDRQKSQTRNSNLVCPATLDRTNSQPALNKNPLPTRNQALGNQAMQSLLSSGVIQAKLKTGQPGDKYEQEADRVAEQVIRMPESQIAERASVPRQTQDSLVQRVCAECDEELHRQPIEEEEEEMLRTKEFDGQTSEVNSNVEANVNAERGGGTPLPESVRSYFEPRFAYDFSQVRIHTDAHAAESALAVNARAFTFGRNIVFGASEYSPETSRGKHLVAHELTHVVQQKKNISMSRQVPSATRIIPGVKSGVGEATRTVLQTTASQLIQRLPFGIRLPTGMRFLDSTERPMARSVYGRSINLNRVLLSDALGGSSRPFTTYLPIPFLGGVTVINIGPSAYNKPGSNRNLLIHELAHSWQSQHHFMPAQFMVNSVASQAAAAVAGGSAYCYKPGKWFGLYAAEQIAEQVENGEAHVVSHVKSKSAGSIDLANILSLGTPRWEKQSTPGVRC